MTSADVVGALDIGGSHVTAGRIRVESATVEPGTQIRVDFPPVEESEVLERILEAAAAVATPQLRHLGVAIPGPFDYEAGISRITHKLHGLYGVNLRRELATALDLGNRGAIAFLNDAEAFVLGEWWAGAARGQARVLGVTLGTGLGSAFLENGDFVRSDARVPAGGALYKLAFRGAPVEETISARALLAGYGGDATGMTNVEQIAARGRAGEAHARLVFRQLAADLAEFLVPTLEAFTPTCLVVGGSIAQAWELLEPVLEERLAAFAPSVVARAAQIDEAPLLGAARHAAGLGV